MKKYSAELISFGLLVCGIGLSWGNVAWFQTEIVRFVWYFGRFYSGRVSRVERGRGVLAGKGVL